MSVKPKKLALMLAITVILLSLTIANVNVVDSSSVGGEIDLFTQKEPYSGKGPNMPSDAFGPGEEVQIYALATYNEDPVQGLLVAFQIIGPPNPIENISFCKVALTDEMGIARTSFRISCLNETTFGEWTVIGNARIGGLTFTDSVSFKVGWIIEIVSLKTVNENYTELEEFARGSYIGIELTLRNIAMTEKTATLTVTIYDCLDTLVNATELINFRVQPNGTFIHTCFLLYIPKSAHVGRAMVCACAYTTLPQFNGVPYCPEFSRSFFITSRKYYLTVRTDPPEIATILGEGWYDESSNVTLNAPAVSDYAFGYWDVNGVSLGSGVNTITVYMDAPKTATAHYTQIIRYTLTITTTAGGTTDPKPGTYNYTAGLTVQVTALPNANYIFDHWELDNVDVGSANPYTVTMDKNHTLKAVFSQAPSAWFVPEWFYLLLLTLLILIAILLIVWLCSRKRKKKAGEAFYTGWTAWYYCYDLRSKTRKF
jgi:hypothetical protein